VSSREDELKNTIDLANRLAEATPHGKAQRRIRELAAEAADAPYARLREIQKELEPVLRTWEASEASPHSLFEDHSEDEEVRVQLSGLIRVLEHEEDRKEPREAARVRARREMLKKIRKLVPF
jgi:galactose-1-phosphate uridylyltransferase